MIRLRDGVASTKRTLADYSNCTLHGWLSSASSAKVRAMLAYKRIPFTDLEPSLEQLKATEFWSVKERRVNRFHTLDEATHHAKAE